MLTAEARGATSRPVGRHQLTPNSQACWAEAPLSNWEKHSAGTHNPGGQPLEKETRTGSPLLDVTPGNSQGGPGTAVFPNAQVRDVP